MRTRWGIPTALISALLLAFVVAPAQATPVTLTNGQTITFAQLAADGTDAVIIGDKEFVFQSCTVTSSAPAIPASGTCPGNFTITADITSNGLIGFVFNGTMSAGSGGSLDIGLVYDVSVISGNQQISEAHLSFAGSPTSDVAVDETITSIAPGGVGCSMDATGVTPGQQTSCNLTTLSTSIQVSKDIAIDNFQPPCSATVTTNCGTERISNITQLFSQTGTVPEPASLALFGMGLLGLGWIVRRKRTGA